MLRDARRAGAARAAARLVTITPRDSRVLRRAEDADRHQGQRQSRVHRRVYIDYIGVKRFDADGNADRRVPHRRPVHLDRLHALDPHDPVSAPQGRRRADAAPASIRTAIPARRWSTCWRPIRATSCSRSTRTRSIDFALAILQLEERPRVRVLARRDRFDRFVSVLVYVPRDRYDSAGARADRRISRRGLQGPRQRLLSVLPGRRRWCACISSSAATAARRRDPDRADAGRGGRRASCAPGPTRFAEALTLAHEPARASALFERYRDAFSDGYREAYSPAIAVDGHPRRSRALSPERPLGVDFYRAPRGRASDCVGLKVWSYGGRSRCRSACRCWRTWASGWSTSAPIEVEPAGDAGRRLAPRHDAGARRRQRDRPRRAASSALEALLPRGDARRRRERRLQRAGAGGRAAAGATSR